MKIYKFFIAKLFFRKMILGLSMILLLFMANYLTFTAARSIISTIQGYNEIKCVNQEGDYIANLDPESNVDMDVIDPKAVQNVYDYLNNNYDYAFYTDGFMVQIPNDDNMEVSLCYMNKSYYELNHFELAQGTNLKFDDLPNLDIEIPVVIGAGLSKSYPVGATIKLNEPVLGRKVALKVQGVLKKNACHSNFYAMNSKNYYNFSIFVPINNTFLKNANVDLKVNGLMDIVIHRTTREKTIELGKNIYENLNFKLNFYSQEENWSYFEEYYFYSLKMISIITMCFLVIITGLSVWNAFASVRLMVRDFTINLLVGLCYSKLKTILYVFWGILSLINLIIIYIVTVVNRYGFWYRKDTTFATYGVLGLIGMDWIALSVVFLSDIMIGIIIVESMVRKIRKVPISLGVLQ